MEIKFLGHSVILATGHSARDIFHLLDRNKIHIEAKSFALGVRIEHPQPIIDAVNTTVIFVVNTCRQHPINLYNK